MKEDLLKIIEHFGIRNQLKKFNEECYELEEAILDYQTEIAYFDEDAMTLSIKRHIAEEIADVMLLLEQFKVYYGITSEEITNLFWSKVARTLQRIESGYYEKQSDNS